MDEIKLKSWGNNFEKSVKVNGDEYRSGINYGNQNSYGDAFIPVSEFSFKVKESSNSDNNYVSSNMEIQEYLSTSDHGLYGIPGKGNVTMGGAIAVDTHGKDNLWGGSFEKNIEEIMLQLPSGEKIITSREKNYEIFQSTIGGYGLTGSILGCKFKKEFKNEKFFLKNIKTNKGLNNLLHQANFDDKSYWVGWVNLLDKNFSWVSETHIPYKTDNLAKKINLDFEFSKINLPFIGRNTFKSMYLINNIYFLKNSTFQNKVIDSSSTLYPLGLFSDTRNVAKKRKIIQIQFSLPFKNSIYIEDLIELLIYKQTPLLCSVKRLGYDNSFNNLSFYQDGWTFAVDFSLETFSFKSINKFISKLNEFEGKIYLAKDSLLNENQFRNMYKNFDKFQKILKEIDPDNIYQSELSKRLGLKNW